MKILLFIICAIPSWILTLSAYVLAPAIAWFVDADGNLPWWLRYYQTPDAPCWGADFWKRDNPNYTQYELIVSWLWRNPAQGFDQSVRAKVTNNSPVAVKGNLEIKDTPPSIGGCFLITCCGYFQLSMIWTTKYITFVSHWGWNLEPIAKGYTHQTLGALKATPLRFYIGEK